jgi:hypothetical protein
MKKYTIAKSIELGRGYQILITSSINYSSSMFRIKLNKLSKFNSDFSERFIHEDDFAFKTVHRNIVPIIEYFISKSQIYIVSQNFGNAGECFG